MNPIWVKESKTEPGCALREKLWIKISLQIQILWTFIVHKYKLLKYIKVFQKWFDVEFTEIEFVRDVRWLLKHVENISEQISCDISDIH